MNAKADMPESTRERLLVVAREVFSEQGFQGATVREICRRAEVNLAAVNYHFSSKEALATSLQTQLQQAQQEEAQQQAQVAQIQSAWQTHPLAVEP